jgi:hypothetical protein
METPPNPLLQRGGNALGIPLLQRGGNALGIPLFPRGGRGCCLINNPLIFEILYWSLE